MTIHYHGLPITPLEKLYQLGGRHFCASFYRPEQVKQAHELGQSVMLDNGAFSHWRAHNASATPEYWNYYYGWCDEWFDYPTTWAVIPDVIDGTEEENDALLGLWPHGTKGAPVWHLHESLDRLKRLCDTHYRVCFGSSGQFSLVGDIPWRHRMDKAFNAIAPSGKVQNWVHMLRGMDQCGKGYPFASVDSTNIARNHKRNGCPVQMADRVDRVQCPKRWLVQEHTQLPL